SQIVLRSFPSTFINILLWIQRFEVQGFWFTDFWLSYYGSWHLAPGFWPAARSKKPVANSADSRKPDNNCLKARDSM
ncbi:MAG: hypothetical protein PVI96_11905, partial [Desulfobacterales bacterium]